MGGLWGRAPNLRPRASNKTTGKREGLRKTKIKERLPSIKGSHDDEGPDGEMSFPEPTQEQKPALLEFDCLAPGTER